MSARPIRNVERPDIWEVFLRRADDELRSPDHRTRIVREAIRASLRSASVLPIYSRGIGAGVEIFLEHGGLDNASATEDLAEMLASAGAAIKKQADMFGSASRTLEIVNIDIWAESRGGAR